MLNNIIDRGGFYSFKDSDPESVRILGSTLADIIDANKPEFDDKTIADTAWKIISHCAGCDTAAEKKAARLYLAEADKTANVIDGFNMYHSVISRRNPHIAEESRAAALKILDLVDTGMLKSDASDHNDVVRCISERIFEPATKAETKDEALAAQAANTLLRLVRTELTKPDTHSAYQSYNIAQGLYAYFPKGDPREAEVLKLWEDALVKSHGSGDDDYYARQMGWMLDSAAKKDDAALVAKTKREWRDTINNIAGNRLGAGQAHRTVQQIVVNAAHYSPDSPLVAEARAMLPDLELRAGIKKVPEKVGNDDFLKMIGKKRQPGFKP